MIKIKYGPTNPPTRNYQVTLDGEILIKSCTNPATDGPRALLKLGHTGPFELWNREMRCMYGDTEQAAKIKYYDTSGEGLVRKAFKEHSIAV